MFHDPGPPWLDAALAAARSLKATTRKARGAGHSVYVILLHDVRRTDPAPQINAVAKETAK